MPPSDRRICGKTFLIRVNAHRQIVAAQTLRGVVIGARRRAGGVMQDDR